MKIILLLSIIVFIVFAGMKIQAWWKLKNNIFEDIKKSGESKL